MRADHNRHIRPSCPSSLSRSRRRVALPSGASTLQLLLPRTPPPLLRALATLPTALHALMTSKLPLSLSTAYCLFLDELCSPPFPSHRQGQEFCRSLRSSVPPPRRRSSTLTGSSLRSEPTTPSTDELPAPAEKPIYCSDAWMELRAHPNIASANLNMLAELVSHDATSVVQRPAPSAAVESSQAAPKAPSDGPSLEEQEWRRRLIIKRKGLDEAIKMLDSKTA